MLVPLHGFVRGDTVGLLVLAEDTDTMAEVAQKLAEAAEVRVRRTRRGRLYGGGVELDPLATVAGLGLAALSRIDWVPEPSQ
jgi:hypothetical protein